MINQTVNSRLHYLGGGIQVMQHLPATVAASDWWNPGGTFTCVAAYQAKGAASLAASYVNLANPGTYDAAPGIAPTWAAGTGWYFDSSSQYLVTGVTPNSQNWSMIASVGSYVGVDYVAICGGSPPAGDARFALWAKGGDFEVAYLNGGVVLTSPVLSTSGGIIAVAGNKGYRNGVHEATITQAETPATAIVIGKDSRYFTSYGLSGYLHGVAIYSTVLDATQVATLSTAMAAL